MSIREMVAASGGFARKRELVALGARDIHLTLAVRSGDVLRARNGWYSTALETDDAFRAVRVGGRLAAASALHALGAWMRAKPPLHVSLPRNSARLRSQWNRAQKLTRHRKHGVIVHWDDPDVADRGSRTSVSLADALHAYILDTPFEEAVAALDWATHTGLLDRFEFDRVISRLPARLRAIGEWIDPDCGSYPESIARTRLRMQGFRVASQVRVGDLRSIDLVIEDIVALEVDGDEFHRTRFLADRDKDLDIALSDRHGLRITIPMLNTRWAEFLLAVRMALAARGWHQTSVPHRRARAVESSGTHAIGVRGRLRLPVVPQMQDEGWRWYGRE